MTIRAGLPRDKNQTIVTDLQGLTEMAMPENRFRQRRYRSPVRILLDHDRLVANNSELH
jgi:hypothetical protein